MMCRPQVLHKRAAVVTRRVAESQNRGGAAVDEYDAFEALADMAERVDAWGAALDGAGAAGNRDLMPCNGAVQSGSWRLAHFGCFGQRAHVGAGGQYGTGERMTRVALKARDERHHVVSCEPPCDEDVGQRRLA